MFQQTSISQIRSGAIQRSEAYVVVCMAHYPRGLKKELIDEYRVNLAPDRELFSEWKAAELKNGHEKAFVLTNYEQRFTLSGQGLESMRRLADISRKKAVYLACQCELGERCHREMLLLIAHNMFSADIGKLYKDYPDFSARLKEGRLAHP